MTVSDRFKMILVNVVVTVLTAIVILTAREAYFTWQRVNATFAWVQQRVQAEADYAKQQQAAQQKASSPTVPESPKK